MTLRHAVFSEQEDFDPLARFVGPLTGPGPHDLQPNKIHLLNSVSAGAFTMRLPGHASNPFPLIGDPEVWLCEIAGAAGPNAAIPPMTLDATPNSVSVPWSLEGIAATQSLGVGGMVAGWKFSSALSVWKALPTQNMDNLRGVPGDVFNATGSPHIVQPFQVHRYDGAVTQQFDMPTSPAADGQKARVLEANGSAVGTITINGNGTNVVNDAGASVASYTLSVSRAFREWTRTGSIWHMTGKVN